MASTAMAALDKEEIEHEVHKKNDDLIACYDAAVDRNPDLPKGKIVTSYIVQTSGKTTSVRTARNDLGDATLASCVRKVFRSLDYGDQDEKTKVNYPLDFD